MTTLSNTASVPTTKLPRPADNWLLLEMIDQAYDGKVIIPDTAKDAPIQAWVLAVGPGKQVWIPDGGYIESCMAEVGDRVLFAKYSGMDLEWEGKTYLFLRDSDVIAFIDD